MWITIESKAKQNLINKKKGKKRRNEIQHKVFSSAHCVCLCVCVCLSLSVRSEGDNEIGRLAKLKLKRNKIKIVRRIFVVVEAKSRWVFQFECKQTPSIPDHLAMPLWLRIGLWNRLPAVTPPLRVTTHNRTKLARDCIFVLNAFVSWLWICIFRWSSSTAYFSVHRFSLWCVSSCHSWRFLGSRYMPRNSMCSHFSLSNVYTVHVYACALVHVSLLALALTRLRLLVCVCISSTLYVSICMGLFAVYTHSEYASVKRFHDERFFGLSSALRIC